MPSDYAKYGFIIQKGIIPKFFTDYLRKYFANIVENNYCLTDDPQCPGSPSIYGDPAFDIAMLQITPIVEDLLGKILAPQNTYARAYVKNAELLKHTDRDELEHSLTLALGSDPWPIYITDIDGKTHSILLEPGDAMVYQGSKLEHWREKFDGDVCYQIFMHWVDAEGEFKDLLYDGRSNLGQPSIQEQACKGLERQQIDFMRSIFS